MARMLLKSRPPGMTFKAYSAMCKASDQEPMDEKDFDAVPEGKDDDDTVAKGGCSCGGKCDADGKCGKCGKMNKAEVSVDDLAKALEAYGDVEAALDGTGGSRESYLTGRVQAGTITKSERAELAALWAQDPATTDRDVVRKSLDEQIADDPDGKKLMDASPFLKSLAESVDASLDQVAARVAEDGQATRTLLKAQGAIIKAQAGIVARQEGVIDALAKRLGVVERTPVVRKSVGIDPRDTRGRNLGTPGGDGAPNALRKSDAAAALGELVKSADAKGDRLAVDKLVEATALFESTGAMKPNIEAAVRAHLAGVGR